VSVCVHALPSLQEAPFATFVKAEVLVLGWQIWQALAGLRAPAA